MKIVNKVPQKTANVSSARGTAGRELWQLVLSAVVLLISLYFIIGFTVDFFVSRISFETEAKIFQQYQLPVPGHEGAGNKKHIETAGAILGKLRTSPRVPPLPYQLVLVEHEMPNAFAFPGGRIGVTTGLLDVLKDDIEIAFVIGHELGHFNNRDHLQGMGRAIGFRIITAIIFGSGSGAESFGDMIDFVIQRGYSQDREKQADRFGLELVHSVYGQVDGVDRLFQILREERDLPEWAYMFSTHPSPDERIDALKEYAAALRVEQ